MSDGVFDPLETGCPITPPEEHKVGLLSLSSARDGLLIQHVWRDQMGRRCTRFIAEVFETAGLGHQEAAERARRLVACWNACEGIPTEALEKGLAKWLTTGPATMEEER